MKEHIQRQHPTVDVSLLSMVYRRASEQIQAIPVTFPTPPGYVPYSDVDFEENWTYVPTPIPQCPKSCTTVNTTHSKQPVKPATVLSESVTSSSSMPVTSETDPTTTTPITSSGALPDISVQDKVNSSGIPDLSSPELDYEFVEDNSSGASPSQHRVTETAVKKTSDTLTSSTLPAEKDAESPNRPVETTVQVPEIAAEMVIDMDSISSREVEVPVAPQVPEAVTVMDEPVADSGQSVDASQVTPLVIPQNDTRRVISLADYCKRRAEEKQIREMEEAVFHLIDTAGYRHLLKDIQTSSLRRASLDSIQEVTRRIRSTLEPRNSAESVFHDQDNGAADAQTDTGDDLALRSTSTESGQSEVPVTKSLPQERSLQERCKSPLADDHSKKSDRECSTTCRKPSKSSDGGKKNRSTRRQSKADDGKEQVKKKTPGDCQSSSTDRKPSKSSDGKDRSTRRQSKEDGGKEQVRKKKPDDCQSSTTDREPKSSDGGKKDKSTKRKSKETAGKEQVKKKKLDDSKSSTTREEPSTEGERLECVRDDRCKETAGKEQVKKKKLDDSKSSTTREEPSTEGERLECVRDDWCKETAEKEQVKKKKLDDSKSSTTREEPSTEGERLECVEVHSGDMGRSVTEEPQKCVEQRSCQIEGGVTEMERPLLPAPRSSAIAPHITEPIGLDLRAPHHGQSTSKTQVVQLPPAPPKRFSSPITYISAKYSCICRCHCRCGSCCPCNCICEWWPFDNDLRMMLQYLFFFATRLMGNF